VVHMSVSNTKKLEAAHHRWQRKILKISWNDMTTNKTVRETTAGQDTLESIIRERRLRWFGHVYRMDSNRIARQAMDWIPSDFKKKRGRPRVSWTSKNLDLFGLTWEEALVETGSNEGSLRLERLYCPVCFYSARKD